MVQVGPPLAALAGLSGVFWVTAGLAAAGIGVTLGLVPAPARSIGAAQRTAASFAKVLRHSELLRLDFAIFTLHSILTASFLVIPRILAQALHLSTAGQWKFYLPVLAAAVVLMVPANIIAETRGRMKDIFIAAIVAIAASLLGLALLGGSVVAVVVALLVFFSGFNIMEAMLLSLVTKFAPAEARGAATGIYSSSQFLGIFVGGAGGGWVFAIEGSTGVLGFAFVLTMVWLTVALTMRRPRWTPRHKM